jgi:glycerol-3-phosphate cytidylyltransferase
MKLVVNTPLGPYKYKLHIVYEGIKVMDKEIGKENLLLFNKIAKKNNLQFELYYGTLLGAIREHDFIAHDEDIDLVMLKEHLSDFKAILFELRENGFEVIRFDRRQGLCSVMRKGEYIDVYFLDELYPGVRAMMGEPTPSKYLMELKECNFQGDVFWIPKDAEEFALFEYGANWKTPIARKTHGMNWLQKKISHLSWWIYYRMPDFIFFPLMEKRGIKKAKYYNYKVERFNSNIGKEVFTKIPENVYKIRKCDNGC